MIRKYLILPILSVLLVTSCGTEPMDTGAPLSQDRLEIVVDLPSEELTRAQESGEDVLNENKLVTLDVFIYESDGNDCAHYQRITTSEGMQHYGLSKAKSQFTQGTRYVTYVVANGGDATNASKTLSELKAAVVATALNPDAVQATILMDGASLPTILNDGSTTNHYIYVSLKRAVAKIRVNLSYGPSFQPVGDVTKKLSNYAATSVVLESGDDIAPTLASTGYTNINTVSGTADQIIMYSYANDWNGAIMDETFVYLNVPLDNNGVTENNYYKIPVNYRRTADDSDQTHLYKLKRNYIYDISVHINRKGSQTAPEAEEIEANYQVIDWTDNEVEVWIKDVEYLYVKDTDVLMMNTPNFTTTFQSSTTNVSIANVQVFVEGRTAPVGNVFVKAQSGVNLGDIDIYSPVPENFVPRVIEFDVVNGTQLTVHVSVTQYPPLWIGHITSAATSSNRNMYTINVMLADFTQIPPPDLPNKGRWGSGDVEGYYFDITGKRYTGPNPYDNKETRPAQDESNCRIGYPLIDHNGYTDSSHENRYMVSPSFMFASKASNYGLCNQWNAPARCSNYSETGEDGTVYKNWRLPTYAELALIDILQNIQKCEIKDITDGHRYWRADPGSSSAYRILNPAGSPRSNENASNAEVRCVRDIGRPLAR